MPGASGLDEKMIGMRSLSLMLAVSLLAPVAAMGAEGGPWQVVAAAKPKIEAFKRKSIVIEDMRTYSPDNWMVYGGDTHNRIPLLPVYDLLACFRITTPKTYMDVDTGGGVDVVIDKVQFAKGKWDAEVRLSEHTRIELLDKERYYLVDFVRVGASKMTKARHKIAAIKIMAQACLPKDAPAPKAKSNGG